MNNDEMNAFVGEENLIHVNPVVFRNNERAKKLAASGHFIVYELKLTEQPYRRLWSFCVENNLHQKYIRNIWDDPYDDGNELETKEFRLNNYKSRTEDARFFVRSRKVARLNYWFGKESKFIYPRGEPKCSTPTIEQLYFKLINEEGAIKSMACNIYHEHKDFGVNNIVSMLSN
ncbi:MULTISPECIES: hypothetical protein [unclassified Aeromonas]|uniref:hypothetical protein n=1 Tax=unclassified Aeromonas TaxID=257493 RepID=UPI0022E62C48|nr:MULTISPECIES: hypothetical protein [unclassified Aeromonas]